MKWHKMTRENVDDAIGVGQELNEQLPDDLITIIPADAPERVSTNVWWAARLMPFIIGAIFVGGGVYWGKHRYEFTQYSETTVGEIIGYQRTDSDGAAMYAPITIFVVDDQPYQVVANRSASAKPFAVGDKVTVFYQQDKPDNAMIDQGWRNWILPAFVILFGGVFWLSAWRGAESAAIYKKR